MTNSCQKNYLCEAKTITQICGTDERQNSQSDI